MGRQAAALALIVLASGALAQPPVRWEERLADGNTESRRQAVADVFLAAVPPERAVPLLVAALQDLEPAVRREAAVGLWDYGKSALGAAPVLAACLRDPSAEVRRVCAGALGALAHEAQEAIPALAGALDDPYGNVRLEALRTLAHFGPAAAEAGERVRRILREEARPSLREQAACALGSIEPASVVARQTLEHAARSDDDAGVRRTAAEAIDTVLAPISVSLRTVFATENVR
jgi:HEAT repeat protein